MELLNKEYVDIQQKLNIDIDWDQSRIKDQVMVVKIGMLTQLTILNTGKPIKQVKIDINDEFVNNCLTDSDG